jgi:hypothetical protein
VERVSVSAQEAAAELARYAVVVVVDTKVMQSDVM